LARLGRGHVDPDIVPAEFAESLSALHFQAPPMHWSVVREVLRDELGDDLREGAVPVDRAHHRCRCERASGARDGIAVPRVLREYSTRRVLTMEYLPGPHLDEFLESDPSQAERDRFR
jgi:predicted unusual protein kinase regulating ubiquinone biosynthesis (AarF/ABC1/UbiB family)